MKNKANKVAQRSLAPVPNRNEVSDSDDEPQPEYGQVAIVLKPQKKHVSPRSMNAMLVGITKRRDPEMRRISESEASVDRALGSDELDAQTSIDGSFQQDLFGDYVQKALESRDVMDQQGDAQEDQSAEDSTPELEPDSDDSASDKDGNEEEATEIEDDIVDETVSPSLKNIRTRSKAKKVNVPDPVMCSDSDIWEFAPQRYP